MRFRPRLWRTSLHGPLRQRVGARRQPATLDERLGQALQRTADWSAQHAILEAARVGPDEVRQQCDALADHGRGNSKQRLDTFRAERCADHIPPAGGPHDETLKRRSHDVTALRRRDERREALALGGVTDIEHDVDAGIRENPHARRAGQGGDAHFPERHHAIGEGWRRRHLRVSGVAFRCPGRVVFFQYHVGVRRLSCHMTPQLTRKNSSRVPKTKATAVTVKVLRDIPNIGPSLAADLRRLGINRPAELAGPRSAQTLSLALQGDRRASGPVRPRHVHFCRPFHGRRAGPAVVALHAGAEAPLLRRTLMRRLLIVFACLTLSSANQSSAQQPAPQDGPSHPFQDSLVAELAGDWTMAGTLLGKPATYNLHAEWVLAHQFLKLEMRDASDPLAYQAHVYLGFDNASERYVAHWIDLFGGRWSETLGYGKRDGDAIRFLFEYPDGPFTTTFARDITTKAWTIEMRQKSKAGAWRTLGATRCAGGDPGFGGAGTPPGET